MESMHEIAAAAIRQVPPDCRVLPEHADTIQRHSEALVAMGPEVVQAFYDTLYAHEVTAQVLGDERPMREETLTNWWNRTVQGPIDDRYWAWMAMVGLVHVVRRVSNPMMLSMAGFVSGFVASNVGRLNLEIDEERRLVEAFNRVTTMTTALITWGFDHSVSAALFEVAGMPEALLANLRDTEVRESLVAARAELG